jgi:raffinose/stachyose/melibiose transport system permease protein
MVASFLLPALLVYGLFVLVPIAQAMWFSLFHWNGLGPLENFVGLDNYVRALNDSVFQMAAWHNTLIVILSLFVQIPFALWLALMLNQRFRGRTLLRLIFFAPYVISEVITGVIWRLLLYPEGMVDQALQGPGMAGRPIDRHVQPVRRHIVEVLWLPHDPAPRGPAGHPARA